MARRCQPDGTTNSKLLPKPRPSHEIVWRTVEDGRLGDFGSRRLGEGCMLFLASRAYVSLLRFETSLVRGRFDSLYDKVRNHPVSKCPRDEETTARVCQAVDLACIWYWKQVLCLQRSAATVCLLRDNG